MNNSCPFAREKEVDIWSGQHWWWSNSVTVNNPNME